MPNTTSPRYGLLYRQRLVFLFLIFVFLLAACSKPNSGPEERDSDIFVPSITVTAAATTSDTPATEPASTAPLEPSPTLEIAATTTVTPLPLPDGSCVWNANYIEDVNLVDGFSVQPATPVRKIWRLVNNGTCPWYAGTQLVVIAGNQLNILPQSIVPQTAAGQTADIYLEFISPGNQGEFESYLQLQSPSGEVFGSVVFLKFTVSATATPLPFTAPPVLETTALPTSSPQPTATPVPATRTPMPTPTPVPTSDATVQPTYTASPVPTSTPTSEPTGTPTPEPTATASGTDEDAGESVLPGAQGAAECAIGTDDRFAGVVSQLGILHLDMGCATSELFAVGGSVQAFSSKANLVVTADRHLSLMVLRNDTNVIYVIQGGDEHGVTNGQLFLALNPWDGTSSPIHPDCSEMAIPSGYTMPSGSFGYLWCQRSLYTSLGWPQTAASEAVLFIQDLEDGVLVQVVPQIGPVYTMALTPELLRATIVIGQ